MGIFLLRRRVQTGSEVHSVSYTMGAEAITPGIKRPGRQPDHLPQSSPEVKNAWSYTSTQPIRLRGVVHN